MRMRKVLRLITRSILNMQILIPFNKRSNNTDQVEYITLKIKEILIWLTNINIIRPRGFYGRIL